MIIIFNSDGSINDSELAGYVQQGSNRANSICIAYADSRRDGLSAYLTALRPDGVTITIAAASASFDCNGKRYEGWEAPVTSNFTKYAGTVQCTAVVIDGSEAVIANYPFSVTVNATGAPIAGEWDSPINVAQYNDYMAQLSGKAAVKRFSTVGDLPSPGQPNAIYLVGSGTYLDAYAWVESANAYKRLTGDFSLLVPYTGAAADVDLGLHKIAASRFDLNANNYVSFVSGHPTLTASNSWRYETTYASSDQAYKQTTDLKEIANAKFVLEQAETLLGDQGYFQDDELAYASKPNASFVDKYGFAYRKIKEDASNIYFGCFLGGVATVSGGTSITFGKLLTVSKTATGSGYPFDVAELTLDVYSKNQAKSTFANGISLTLDPVTFELTASLDNGNGEVISVSNGIDLPLESIIVSATYYDTYVYDGTTYTKVVVMTLATTSVPTIIPVGDLVSGLEKEACVEIPVSPTSGTFTVDQMALLALDNARIKIGGYTYLHKVLANQFIAKSAFVSADGYKTESEYKVVVQNNGNYTLTSTTIEFYDKSQVDAKVTDIQNDMAKMKKDIDYALKYPLIYGTPTTDTDEDIGLTTAQLPATTLPKGLINYVGGSSFAVNQLCTVYADTTDVVVGLDKTISNNKITLSGTANDNDTNLFNNAFNVIAGHKYFILTDANGTPQASNVWQIYEYDAPFGSPNYEMNNEILTATSSGAAVLRVAVYSGAQIDVSFYLEAVDLTQMFGVGNEPTTTSDPRIQWLIGYLAENPEYDEGSIVNAPVENIKSTDGASVSNYPIPAEVQALDGYGLGIDDTLYNYIDFERKKFVKRVAVVDLGTLNWYYSELNGVPAFTSGVAIDCKSNSEAICECYEMQDGYSTTDKTFTLTRGTAGTIWIIDSSYTDAGDFTTAMDGKKLVYELATPTETDISEYLDRDFPNENLIDLYQGGEVEFENDNDMAVPYSLTYQYKVE